MSRWGRYRSQNGRFRFEFRITRRGAHYEVVCVRHPPFLGRDHDVHKTHLYSDGSICFSSGRHPTSAREAESRAAEWAEFFSGYLG